jgi:hypothetical protein
MLGLLAVGVAAAVRTEGGENQPKPTNVVHFVGSVDEAETLSYGRDKLEQSGAAVTQYLASDNTVAETTKYRVFAEIEAVDGRRAFISLKQRVGVGEFEPGFVADRALQIKRVRWLWKYRDAFFAPFDASDWAEAPADHYVRYAILSWHGKNGWYPPKVWSEPR